MDKMKAGGRGVEGAMDEKKVRGRVVSLNRCILM